MRNVGLPLNYQNQIGHGHGASGSGSGSSYLQTNGRLCQRSSLFLLHLYHKIVFNEIIEKIIVLMGLSVGSLIKSQFYILVDGV